MLNGADTYSVGSAPTRPRPGEPQPWRPFQVIW